MASCVVGILSSCSPSSLIDVDVPAGTNDPRAYNTAEGALARYHGVITKFRLAMSGGGENTLSFIPASGLLSDELYTARTNLDGYSRGDRTTAIDSRNIGEDGQTDSQQQGVGELWTALHSVRLAAIDAIGALQKYARSSPADRIGHSYAMWGMAEVALAELYCSGIPLSTIEFEGGIKYASGSNRDEVYRHAIAMFDSALVYTDDSVSYRYLAMVGKGWAFLGLNLYDSAANAVADVPTDFAYQNRHSLADPLATNFTYFRPESSLEYGNGSVADREGGTGLPYRSAADPRIEVDPMPPDPRYPGLIGYSFRQIAGSAPGTNPVTVASGIEARLIRAEAELSHDNPAWLTTLNQLRAGYNGGDLEPLDDPIAPQARVDTLFKERAFWLYLSGRRLGDMRRLVRQYKRSPNDIFPRGAYPAWPSGAYGSSVNLVPPVAERQINTSYKGCIDRNA